jgi:hypothetical protein
VIEVPAVAGRSAFAAAAVVSGSLSASQFAANRTRRSCRAFIVDFDR